MARSDFLSINTVITNINALSQDEFNIALAYDLDFKMPPVKFENGKPVLSDVEGERIFVMSFFDGKEWDYSCVVFMRERLMPYDIGPIMPVPMLTTLYSCNFNKLPCAHQIKRFGDWLNEINHKEKKYYGFEFIMARDGIYYKYIETNCNKLRYKPVKKCISLIAKDGKLTKGFATAVSIYDRDLGFDDAVASVGNKIMPSFRDCYKTIKETYSDDFIYRMDGGKKEAMLQAKLQYYAMKVKKNVAETVAF